ncbi:hypothetical protein C943_02641 [Mariniradius saccharolyticus AK6]|uniref:Uncharacterized protein n=1 Tax=Mariniradius saccharolyticus AK6 TaxID=1239962 RepID=M7X8M0_9BACT|nr:hypothetical protein C943_02641 [Mariniradius saccharolyticus AK6]
MSIFEICGLKKNGPQMARIFTDKFTKTSVFFSDKLAI